MGAFRMPTARSPEHLLAHKEAHTSLQPHLGPSAPGLLRPAAREQATGPNFSRHLLFSVFVTSSLIQADLHYLFEEYSGLFASFYG